LRRTSSSKVIMAAAQLGRKGWGSCGNLASSSHEGRWAMVEATSVVAQLGTSSLDRGGLGGGQTRWLLLNSVANEERGYSILTFLSPSMQNASLLRRVLEVILGRIVTPLTNTFSLCIWLCIPRCWILHYHGWLLHEPVLIRFGWLRNQGLPVPPDVTMNCRYLQT
jgi:hypothetical protein